MSNLGNICARAFFFKDDHGAKMWKIFKVGIHIDGGVNDTCLQGRIFKTFSEKLKNAIKIKIGCVVIKLQVLKLNPDHLGSSKILRI